MYKAKFIFVLFVFVVKFAVAATPASTGLHLSFEQRLALTYALLAQGESQENKQEILERAKAYFQGVYNKEVEHVKVKNFEEFLRLHKGAWPNTHSVKLDLEILEKQGPRAMKIFEAESPRIQKQIDTYLEWQQEQLKSMAQKQNSGESLDMEKLAGQAMALLQNPEAQKIAENWALQESEALLADRMKELDRVGEKIAQNGFAQQQDKTMRIFMETMFSEYFSRLSPESKKLIVSSYLGGDLLISDMKKFEIMVQNSGPQLQKLLQVVARQADLGPEMLEVFRALENSVRPVPWVQVEQIVSKEHGNYKFTYFERKALGVGTMAQVHRAKITVDGKRHDVVVRFIKPGIAERVQEDKVILTEVAKILDNNPEFRKTGAPKLTPIIEDITATVTAELSQEDTIRRQQLAKTRYDRTVLMKTPEYKNYIEFNVPRIYESTGESNLMVQEMVIGKKLDKEVALYKEVAPEMKKAVIENMAKLWANEVMFGGGFYHSDLHQGNFMMHVTDPKIRLHILDFGMGGVISESMQRQVMVLGAGTELLNAELIARAFWNLSDKNRNTVNQTQLQSLVAERIRRIHSGAEVNTSLEHWTAFAMDNGIKLPYEFVSLNRGIVIVNKLLADAGSKLTVTSMMKSYAVAHPAMVYQKLVVEEKISRADLIKLGWSEMKSVIFGAKEKVVAPAAGALRCEAIFL
ncbi:AarF/UbiB family protein [Bdellovibrio bacteriovorus]|uniref:AarF/UbiB family protein n=1 Tax=Bdellovibrio bacteriovorus TaxID=959 RepID=UPI0035A6BD1A